MKKRWNIFGIHNLFKSEVIKMTFLKWYTFIIILLSFLMNLYKHSSDDDITGFIVILIMTLPMLVYLFLS